MAWLEAIVESKIWKTRSLRGPGRELERRADGTRAAAYPFLDADIQGVFEHRT